MKTLLFAFTLSVALACGSQSAFAQAAKKPAPADAAKPADTAKAPGAEAAKPDRPITFFGDVASVDAAAKTITLKAKDPTKGRTFQVGDSTKIVNFADGKGAPATLADVKADAYITGSYKKAADGKLEAVTVNLGKTKGAPKGTPDKAPAPKAPAPAPEPKPKTP